MREQSWIRALSLWGPCVLYASLIFLVSSIETLPAVGSDSVAHLLEYAVLGALLARAFAGGSSRVGLSAVLFACMTGTAYGLTDEFHQSFVPGRISSTKDVLMDAVGAMAGAMGIALIGAHIASWFKTKKAGFGPKRTEETE